MAENGEMSTVWARIEGTWYAAIAGAAEDMGLDPPAEGHVCVQILDTEEMWSTVLPSDDVIPFDYDEKRLADSKAASSIQQMMLILHPPQAADEDAAAEDVEEKQSEKKDKKDKKDKKEKKDKKTKKEERRREKERRREEKAQRKRDRSPSSEEDDEDDDDEGSDGVATPRRGGDDDGLDAFIGNDVSQGRRGGAIVSRLHDRTKISITSEVDPGRNYLSSVPSSMTNLLHRAKNWYEERLTECKSSGRVMPLHEVDVLRAVQDKLRNNAAVLVALQRNARNLFGAFKDRVKNEIDSLKKFDVEEFCAAICSPTIPPPQKPEKRKGARFFALDSQLRDLLDIGKPALTNIDNDLLKKIEHDEKVGSAFSRKSGLVKTRIMSQWLAGRELAVVGKTFEVQPVAAHGAVARRFSEFKAANETKALNKASRSVEFSRYLTQSKPNTLAESRASIGSYFNFHDFRDYEHASLLHDSELFGDAASSVPPELALEFDPDATFNTADNDLAGALQAFEQSAHHVTSLSAQRSALALPSDQSMWAANSSVTSIDEERVTAQPPAAEPTEPTPRASTSSVSGDGQQQQWKRKVLKVIADHASLYVFGQHNRPLCLPQSEFNRVVSTCLKRTSDVQNKRDRTLSILGGNEATWELSARDIKNIGASVEHYIRRHYLDGGVAGGRPGVNPSYGRARSASRQAEYE
jgi:hypothetical protein